MRDVLSSHVDEDFIAALKITFADNLKLPRDLEDLSLQQIAFNMGVQSIISRLEQIELTKQTNI